MTTPAKKQFRRRIVVVVGVLYVVFLAGGATVGALADRSHLIGGIVGFLLGGAAFLIVMRFVSVAVRSRLRRTGTPGPSAGRR